MFYRIYFNTEFAWPYVEIAEASSEKEALDKTADKLHNYNSNLVMTYDKILEARAVGQSADGYIKSHGLVSCGTGLYASVSLVEKMPFTEYGVKAFKDTLKIPTQNLVEWSKSTPYNMAARFLFEHYEAAFGVIEEIKNSERLKKVQAYIGNNFDMDNVLEELYLMFEDKAIPKRSFKIPVVWEMCGAVTVEAKNLKEAIEKVRNDNDDIPLPSGDYVDGSFQLSTEDEGTIALYQKI